MDQSVLMNFFMLVDMVYKRYEFKNIARQPSLLRQRTFGEGAK